MTYTVDPRYPTVNGQTTFEPTAGNKRVKMQMLDMITGPVSDIGKAPVSRVYTRDYAKTTEPDPGASSDFDYVTAAVGKNPFRL